MRCHFNSKPPNLMPNMGKYNISRVSHRIFTIFCIKFIDYGKKVVAHPHFLVIFKKKPIFVLNGPKYNF